MKISVQLDLQQSVSSRDSRTNVYVWKGLDDLKAFYAGSRNSGEIDRIADKVRSNKKLSSGGAFQPRGGIDEFFNESCLCNLVEMALLDNSDIMDIFFEKSVIEN